MAINVVATEQSAQQVGTANHVIEIPVDHEIGQVVVAYLVGVPMTDPANFTWPSGWEVIFDSYLNDGVAPMRFNGRYHVITGEESWFGSGTPSITVTSSGGHQTAHGSYLIADHDVENTAPEVSAATTGGPATTYDPPSISPSWGDEIESCILAIVCVRSGAAVISGFPEGYSNTISSNGDNVQAGSAAKIVTAVSEDPGTFTGPSGQFIIHTLAIKGAAAPPEPLSPGRQFPVVSNLRTFPVAPPQRIFPTS